MGAWLILYLFEHLLVNSQAALFFKDEGKRFISMVNRLEDLPFLPAIEILFIGLPFLVHIVWGVIYLLTAKMNSFPGDGLKPTLPHYRKNRAYSWQRITSWLLVVGVLAHVVHMRFLHAPKEVGESIYQVRVHEDARLSEVAGKLEATLVPDGREVTALVDSPGKGFFLMVRESFKSLSLVMLYSLFVIIACYHAFNGLWTFLITWGVTLKRKTQSYLRLVALALMWVTLFLGLFSIWGLWLQNVR